MEITMNFLSDNNSDEETKGAMTWRWSGGNSMEMEWGEWHGDGLGRMAWSGGNGMEMDWGEWHGDGVGGMEWRWTGGEWHGDGLGRMAWR